MYNKIFTKILDSSIWLESNPTRIVWLTFLASMDETGFSQFASVANVAHRARVSDAEAEEAIKCLTSPDANSSDPENEGRRLERVPGGWMVLNAEKYRALVTRAITQEKTRQRVAAWRERKKGNAIVTEEKRPETPSETEAEAKSEEIPSAPDKPARARNELSDYLAKACGLDPMQLTKSAATTCAVKANEIRRVCHAVDASEFLRRAANYRANFPQAALTPAALCNQWAACDRSHGRTNSPPLLDAAAQAESAKLRAAF